jgi:DNA primase
MGLLGVSIKPQAIEAILKAGYEEAVVFLDGDNPQVRMAARAIAKRLPFLRTRIVETGTDPKDYSKEELSCLILK